MGRISKSHGISEERSECASQQYSRVLSFMSLRSTKDSVTVEPKWKPHAPRHCRHSSRPTEWDRSSSLIGLRSPVDRLPREIPPGSFNNLSSRLNEPGSCEHSSVLNSEPYIYNIAPVSLLTGKSPKRVKRKFSNLKFNLGSLDIAPSGSESRTASWPFLFFYCRAMQTV